MGNKEVKSRPAVRHQRSHSNNTNIISDSPFKTRGVFTRAYSIDEESKSNFDQKSNISKNRLSEIFSSPLANSEEDLELRDFLKYSNSTKKKPNYKHTNQNTTKLNREKYFEESMSLNLTPVKVMNSKKKARLSLSDRNFNVKENLKMKKSDLFERLLKLEKMLFYRILEFLFDEIPNLELVSSKFYVKINDSIDHSLTIIDNRFIKTYYQAFSFSKSGIKTSILPKAKGFRIDRIIEAEVLKSVTSNFSQ